MNNDRNNHENNENNENNESAEKRNHALSERKRLIEVVSNIPAKGEMIMLFAYIPIHLVLLPLLLSGAMADGTLSSPRANLVLYSFGAVYMLVFAGNFLRREFNPLCDHPVHVGLTVVGSYGLMLCFNMALFYIMALLGYADNPNNSAVQGLADEARGTMTAVAVYLAPIVEELMFRGAIFGVLRWRNRTGAYIVSMLSFALFHVLDYALMDAHYWIYMLQYLPVSWLLCRCYERSNTIWGSIFLHMLINGIAMSAM